MGNQLINLAFVHGQRQANYQRWTADYETYVVAETARQSQRDRLSAMREQSELIVGREVAAGKAFEAGTSVPAQRDRARAEEAETKRAAEADKWSRWAEVMGVEEPVSSAEELRFGLSRRKTEDAALASTRFEEQKRLLAEQNPDDAGWIASFDDPGDIERYRGGQKTLAREQASKAKAAEIAAVKLAYSGAKDQAVAETKRLRFAAKQRAHDKWEEEMSGKESTDDDWWDFDRWWTARAQEYAVSDVTVEDVLRRQRNEANALAGGGPTTAAPATGGGQRIKVIFKATGQPGTIPPGEFDPAIYDRVQ